MFAAPLGPAASPSHWDLAGLMSSSDVARHSPTAQDNGWGPRDTGVPIWLCPEPVFDLGQIASSLRASVPFL